MSTAVQQLGTTSIIPAPASETAAIIHMIERAARDPAVDIDKLHQLLALRIQVEERAAKREFASSMKEAQSEMRPIATDSVNPQTRSKYASYAALDRSLRPIYTKHGFYPSFNTGDGAPEGHVRVLCDLEHTSGHTRQYHIDMPNDGKGAKGGDVMTKTHATGSAVSYGMRYLLKMIFNIAIGDDDGNAAGGTETITAEQIEKIQTRIVEVGADIPSFCKAMKVERVEDVRAKDFDRAMKGLQEVEDWAKSQAKKGAK